MGLESFAKASPGLRKFCQAGDQIMRSFIAIPLSEGTRANLRKCREKLKSPGLDIKWVEEDNFHITLFFLGDISEAISEALVGGIRDITAAAAPFSLSIKGVGAFPNTKRPRVIWAGVEEGKEEIKLLYRQLVAFLKGLGFEESRNFSPHITLGRFRSPVDMDAVIPQYKKVKELGGELVQGISLMESTLTDKGPLYSEIAYFKFRKKC